MNRFLAILFFGIQLATDRARGAHLRSERNLATLPDPSNLFSFNGFASDVIDSVIGVLSGPVTYSSVAIEGRQSLELSCCNASVLLDSVELKNAFTDYTISLWFLAKSKGGYRYLYEEGSASVGLAIRLNGATLEAAMTEGGPANIKVVSAGTVELGKWNHAVLLYSNGQLSIGLNGNVLDTVATGFGEFDKHSNAASIGSPGLNNVNSTIYYVGLIDDLRIWDGTALTDQQVAALYAEGASSSGLTVSHQWSFNGNNVDLISGIIGTEQGTNSYSNDAIEGSKSLRLSSQSSVLLNNTLLKGAFTSYTVSLWFRADSTGGYRYLYEEGGSGTGFAIRLNEATLEVAMVEGGGGIANIKVVNGGIIGTGIWYHAVMVYDNGMLSVSLNGVLSDSLNTGYGQFAAHSDPASVGSPGLNHYNSGVYFDGLIDDLRIWDGTALNAAQISELYRLFFPDSRPNIVLLVADDMNFDSPGFMGGVAPKVTPNLDKLASESLLFKMAYAAESVCQPSRQAMLSGKYPPNYGAVGFFPMAVGTPTAVTSLKDAGYVTASFYKNYHMRPYSSFPWTMTDANTVLPGRENRINGVAKEIGRSPTMLGAAAKQTIATAKSLRKPFFLVINSSDPHRPFHGTEDEDRIRLSYQIEKASRIYNVSEVKIPKPLPDIPGVRDDIAHYASSVRRLDDTVGRVLAEIDAAGIGNNTIIFFVSDNGMPMPFGKFETYRDSYNGPMIVKWPGLTTTTPRVDTTHLVSLTDIAPTIIDIAGAQPLRNIDGRSLVPLIENRPNVAWRDVAVGTRYEDIFYGNHILLWPDPEAFRAELRAEGWVDAPEHSIPGTMKRTMNKRGITDGTYHYIFNHYYPFFHANNISSVYEYAMDTSYLAMMNATLIDADIKSRMEFYNYRPYEEFYNLQRDPGYETNLMGRQKWSTQIANLKQKLLDWMIETNDPILADYQAYLGR